MQLDFDKGDGLLPAVIQDSGTGRVLMLGYMNSEALQKTLESGYVTFFSRSRNSLWVKGESSGHRLKVQEVQVDCDQDALVVMAEQSGPGTCHRGYRSCFYRRFQDGALVETERPAFDPGQVYGATSAGPSPERSPAKSNRQE